MYTQYKKMNLFEIKERIKEIDKNLQSINDCYNNEREEDDIDVIDEVCGISNEEDLIKEKRLLLNELNAKEIKNLKKEWEEFKGKVLDLTKHIPKKYIKIEIKELNLNTDESNFEKTEKALITIYDNIGNLTNESFFYQDLSYDLNLRDYIDMKGSYDDRYDCGLAFDTFWRMLYEMVAKASAILFKEMEWLNKIVEKDPLK